MNSLGPAFGLRPVIAGLAQWPKRTQAVTTPGASPAAWSRRPCRRLSDGDINRVSTFDGWANRWATRGEVGLTMGCQRW
jgi:hypothetical protein